MSTSSSYETVTTEMPALEMERTPCVRGSPIIPVSMGKLTRFSTSLGDRPGATVMTCT
jgi:hypothetical protein